MIVFLFVFSLFLDQICFRNRNVTETKTETYSENVKSELSNQICCCCLWAELRLELALSLVRTWLLGQLLLFI